MNVIQTKQFLTKPNQGTLPSLEKNKVLPQEPGAKGRRKNSFITIFLEEKPLGADFWFWWLGKGNLRERATVAALICQKVNEFLVWFCVCAATKNLLGWAYLNIWSSLAQYTQVAYLWSYLSHCHHHHHKSNSQHLIICQPKVKWGEIWFFSLMST